jgi:hypothetical protein
MPDMLEMPPREWIDKIFNCLELFYGERWTRQFDRWMPQHILKSIWQSSLTGCTYDEIKRALILLKRSATDSLSSPPHNLEFFRYVKGTSYPPLPRSTTPEYKSTPEVARAALDEINAKIRYRAVAIEKENVIPLLRPERPEDVLRETKTRAC